MSARQPHTPLWEAAAQRQGEVVLRHYTERLDENPDWLALRAALEQKHDLLVSMLCGSASDTAEAARLHALRGEIRGIRHVLERSRIEARTHQARQTG